MWLVKKSKKTSKSISTHPVLTELGITLHLDCLIYPHNKVWKGVNNGRLEP